MFRTFCYIMLLSCSFLLLAQEPVEVKVSKDRVMIAGKTYYIHVVEKGQTLYSISKAYGVTIDDITAENPLVTEGLRIGVALKIPAVTKNKQDGETKVLLGTESKPVYISPDNDQRFIYHSIKQGETVFSIAKKYSVPIDSIIKNNPNLDYSNVQINEIVRVPKISHRDSLTLAISAEVIFHEVKRKETLYSIAKQYDVSVENILLLNPEIKADKLTSGSIIKIPKGLSPVDSLMVSSFNFGVPLEMTCDTLSKEKQKRMVHVALLMPFFTTENKNPSVFRQDNTTTKNEIDQYIFPLSFNAIEFYSGFLLAMENFKRSGYSIHLSVYDTENDTSIIKDIIASGSLDNVELVIGPAYTHEFMMIADYCKQKEIIAVSPFSYRDTVLANNSFVFQINPSAKTRVSSACRFLTSQCNKNVVLVYGCHIADYDISNDYRNTMRTMLNDSLSCLDDSLYKEVYYVDNSTRNAIGAALSVRHENLIVILSEREAMVGKVISDLIILSRDYAIKLFGFPRWQTYQNIDLEYLADLEMTFFTPYYVDFHNRRIRNFIERYRMLYATDIYKISSDGFNFSLLGYDVASYFITALLHHGKDFRSCINSVSYKPLQTAFQFRQVNPPFSGFENHTLLYYRYKKNMDIAPVFVSFK